jgi:hypothetical protein
MANNHDLVADYCEAVQTELNKAAGIGIKAIRPELNQDKIDGIVNRLSEEDAFEKISWILEEPVLNFIQSVVDDAVKENAEFHHKAGLGPKIIRKEVGNCCDWCKKVVGSYEYPDVPKDVYRRHRYCRCTVEYDPGDGRRQNAHTKKWRDPDEKEKVEARKRLDSGKKDKQSAKPYIQKGFKDGSLKDSINREKQARHLENFNTGKSYIYGNEKDAEELYNKLKGTGEAIVDRKGKWTNKERVTNDSPVGVDKNTGETKNAMIVYSKTGSHIYPRKEDDK